MILDKIINQTKQRLQIQKQSISLEQMKKLAFLKPIQLDFPFEKALNQKHLSFILEVKKASPSKGLIANNFDYLELAKEYEKIGADAISVLTEPYFFQGDIQYLKEIKNNVHIPILRKDFIIDEYMIYEAKANGADAILLICAILTPSQLIKYITLTKKLGMSTLVETHDMNEIAMAIQAKAKIIGVNNRNLKDFTVDFQKSISLRYLIPDDIIFISESGIHTHQDIQNLAQNHVDAVLIGEALVISENRKKTLDILRGSYED